MTFPGYSQLILAFVLCSGCTKPGNVSIDAAMPSADSGNLVSACTDAKKNGDETDVDCGGAGDCPRCVGGRKCVINGDCLQGSCHAGLCRGIGFAMPVEYQIPVGVFRSIAAGDLNGDKISDIVVPLVSRRVGNVTYDGSIGVLMTRHDGTLSTTINYPFGANYAQMADFDGNGALDVAVLYNKGVGVLLNQGGGKLSPPLLSDTQSIPNHFAVGDLDGDGMPDILLTSELDGTIEALFNRNGGRMETAGSYDFSSSSGHFVSLGDLNNDGRVDAVITLENVKAQGGGSAIAVALNTGNGVLGMPHFYHSESYKVQISDVTGDGSPDLVAMTAITGGKSAVIVFKNNGAGLFDGGTTYPRGEESEDIVLGDFDGDGTLDAASNMRQNEQGTLFVHANSGGGVFGTTLAFPAGPSPYASIVTDLNGDRMPDVILAAATAQVGFPYDTVTVLLNTSLR